VKRVYGEPIVPFKLTRDEVKRICVALPRIGARALIVRGPKGIRAFDPVAHARLSKRSSEFQSKRQAELRAAVTK
jgi:hypothetical protein